MGEILSIEMEKRTWQMLRRTFIWLLLLFYTMGILGLTGDTRELFSALSPVILLFTAFLLFLDQREYYRAALFFCSSFILGYLVEFIGVHFGWLFGSYHYGQTLGIKLFKIPLLIGVNWFLISICAGYASAYLVKKRIWRILLGSVLMVFTDFWIEPVASALDYWHWSGQEIPYTNYLHWFLIGLLMQWLFVQIFGNRTNKLSARFYLLLTTFFVLLNLLL